MRLPNRKPTSILYPALSRGAICFFVISISISAELFISHRTVENHRANICQKLELKGSHSLIKFAFDHKSQLS